ncbi:hypothetical protein [Natronoglomus mannanivorans]|uniref:Uncharacterized protein n=1 Tax=Natronoglomus mannanivorans TaxID=2979990 RepID=A0AAP2Z2X6_9EURY|nr:hypothetical protein [Halobacteria archaeon AArc-xg1-1]
MSTTAILVGGVTAQTGLTGNPDNSSAIPEYGPAYGVENSTFQILWSEDVDDGNLSVDDFEGANVSSDGEFATRLAKSTDVSFEQPPDAVETWNDGDFEGFSPGGDDESVHPNGASLEDDEYIKDAYVEIYAVQPSTILHEDNGTTQYVAPDGDVLAISDYRVLLPEDDTSGSEQEEWSLTETSVDSIELKADGETISTDDGHQTTLSYQDLSGSVELTVEAEITATIKHVTLDCPDWVVVDRVCEGLWSEEVDHLERSKTVTASRDVVVSQLSESSGTRVEFEADDDRMGAVINANSTWSTIDVDGDVQARSNWWFYTAGKSGWHTMVTRTATESTRTESSMRPLQVHAYPDRERPNVPTQSIAGENSLLIEEAWGAEQSSPSLPANIDIDPAETYVDADSIALSSTTLEGEAFDEVTVQGIVQGQSQTVSLDEPQTVRETNLTLSVLESNSTRATVRAEVTENTTGNPVSTGQVVIGDQSTPVNASGMAVLEVSSSLSLVRGQYVPQEWWHTDRPYASAEDRTKLPPNFPEFRTLVQLALVTLLWFVPLAAAVFGFDYLTRGTFLGLTDRQ